MSLFAVVGMATLLFARARAPAAMIEPENGSTTASVIIRNDATASGGKSIQFAAGSVRQNAPGLPAQGALLGVSTNPTDGSGISKLEDASHMNRKFDFTVAFTDFNSNCGGMLDHLSSVSDGCKSNAAVNDLGAGRIPLLTWQLASYSGGLNNTDGSDYITPAIAAGTYDGYITQVADRVKALQKPIYLRIGHEMNGNWYGWSGCNGSTCRPGAGAAYIAAWRHIYDLFQSRGATNTVWVWSPNGNDVPNIAGHHWTDYYPGDQYVNIVGIDQYVHSPTKHLGDVLSNTAGSIYGDYAAKKPIIVVETMSGPRPRDPIYYDKSYFFAHMATVLQTKFPGIAGIAIFDHNKYAQGDGEYSIERSGNASADAATMAAFVAMTKNCYFGSDARQAACR